MRTITAVYENGLFRPTEKIELPEGTTVRLELEGTAPAIRDMVPPVNLGTPDSDLRSPGSAVQLGTP